MANHIRNHVKITGNPERIKEVSEFLKSNPENKKQIIFDCNKIIPMPEKWNAYNFKDTIQIPDGLIYVFDTAWTTPFPVIKKLAELFPDLTIYVEYADEDLGFNFGYYEFANREFKYENEYPISPKSRYTAYIIRNGIPTQEYLDELKEEREEDEYYKEFKKATEANEVHFVTLRQKFNY